MCKKCQNIFIGLKKTCLGVLDRGERNKDNKTGLKKGGGIEMSTTVLHSRAAPSLKYLPPYPTYLPGSTYTINVVGGSERVIHASKGTFLGNNYGAKTSFSWTSSAGGEEGSSLLRQLLLGTDLSWSPTCNCFRSARLHLR